MSDDAEFTEGAPPAELTDVIFAFKDASGKIYTRGAPKGMEFEVPRLRHSDGRMTSVKLSYYGWRRARDAFDFRRNGG